jgi:hypothetical protein
MGGVGYTHRLIAVSNQQCIERNFQNWAMHNRLFGNILYQSPVQPSLEEGALMALDNHSEAPGTASD